MKVNAKTFALALDTADIKTANKYQLANKILSGKLGLDTKLLEPFVDWDEVHTTIKEAKRYNIDILSFLDNSYPDNLLNTYDYPFVLFYKGDISLLSQDSISIVGTRLPSPYGIDIVNTFVPQLVDNNIVTVSGLAIGIDTEVHRITLEYKGKTIAVLGSGLNRVYPKQNTYLYSEIIEQGGLVISEYHPNLQASKYTFPKRNRIIAAISPVLLVVEAGLKSGSLITAKYASSYSRTVMACPGDIFNNYSVGTNNLIKYGSAVPVTTVDDVLQEYTILQKPSKQDSNLSDLEKKVLDTIISRGTSLNTIATETGYPISEILVAMENLKNISAVNVDEFGLYTKR